jgi:hypothetical protein
MGNADYSLWLVVHFVMLLDARKVGLLSGSTAHLVGWGGLAFTFGIGHHGVGMSLPLFCLSYREAWESMVYKYVFDKIL